MVCSNVVSILNICLLLKVLNNLDLINSLDILLLKFINIISGVKWHDVACHMRSKIVCEDSEALLQRALRENPGQVIPEPVAKKT